jgi:hypothetical protein
MCAAFTKFWRNLMAKLLVPLETIFAALDKKRADLQTQLDSANATIATLQSAADPNITSAGIDAANAQAVALGLAPDPNAPAAPASTGAAATV